MSPSCSQRFSYIYPIMNHGSWSINRLLELAVTSTSQPCTAQGSLFSQRPSCQLQFPVANTFPWTPSTPQCSLILEVELAELLKDFGLISDPTENSMYQSCKYILEQLSGQKLSMIYLRKTSILITINGHYLAFVLLTYCL